MTPCYSTWVFISLSCSFMTFTCTLDSAVCFSSCGILKCSMKMSIRRLELQIHYWSARQIWYTKRTSSLSSLCLSSASFSIMFACVSLVSSSFSFRSLCLKTFSRFWKTVRRIYESFSHRKLFHFLLREPWLHKTDILQLINVRPGWNV